MPTNSFLKPSVIARTMIDLLYRELVVARTVWTDAVNPTEFTGALNDTVTVRVPAHRSATTRTLRAGTPIANAVSTEHGVPVTLDTDVYNGAPISDEELSLDIVDFGRQILLPQVRAVAEGVEDQIVSEITSAEYEHAIVDIDETDPYDTLVDVRKILNDSNVPKSGRTLLCGSSVESTLLKSDRFIKTESIGETRAVDALSESVLGRIAGFTVLQSNAVDEDEAYAYHRSAFVLACRAPRVPTGVSMGTTRQLSEAEAIQSGAASSLAGIGVRWLMDYDYANTTDRSLVNTWVGTQHVQDFAKNASSSAVYGSDTTFIRAVKLSLSGS
jgi:hypothetical protein